MSGARFAVALLLLCSCASSLPWNNAPDADEVNLAFTVHNNLLFLPSATINGKTGRFLFGSATPRTVVDPRNVPFLGGPNAKYTITFGERASFKVQPAFTALGNIADAEIGYDAFADRAVTIDYRAGLVTYQKAGIHPDYMTMFRYTGDPAIDVMVNGKRVSAIVDTSSPDTLTLPGDARRGHVHVSIANSNLGDVDVAYAPVERAHIGNRLLSKFLVAIDYRNHAVGVWRDPRIP